MSAKNLESFYRINIEDIDAERIKERLQRYGFEEPHEEMKNIARTAINLGLAATNAPECTVDFSSVFASFMTLESLFNFFEDLTLKG